jgi:hypothetical protein
MAYAILRLAKLKSAVNVRGSAYHIERLQPTPNARPGVTNPWVAGGPNIYERAKAVWAKIPKIKKDAVHGIEVVMTASPEAFQGDDPVNVDKWARDSTEWLKTQFKGCVILGVNLQLDESTPHLQAVIIPTDRKPDGTPFLNAKKYVGNKGHLNKMQTAYWEAVKCHGLERGVEGSTAKHTTIAQYYGALGKAVATKVTRPVVEAPPMILTAAARNAWATAQTKKLIDAQSPQIIELKARAAQGRIAEKQNAELKKSNSDLRRQLAESKRKEAAARLRELPLDVVAQALGCHKTPKTLAKDKDLWESPAGKISIKGTKFFNQESGLGGGGAFDLVMHINECDYVQALAWLRDEFDPSSAVQAAMETARIKAEAEVERAPQKPFEPPMHVESTWPRVREYLTTVRALAGDLVDKLRAAGWLGSDHRNNAYFVKQEGNRLTSVELKGTGRSSYTGSRGRSSEGVFLVNGGKEKLAVCESPIDAISYVQLHPHATAIATGGTGKWAAAIQFLVKHRDKFKSVVCASDLDEAGIEMAKNLHLDHEPPPNGIEDWNEAVKALRDDPDALSPQSGFSSEIASEAPRRPSKRPSRSKGDDLTLG